MSGAICPDCSGTWLGKCPNPDPTWKQPCQCETCGWRGDIEPLGRKILMPEGYDRSSYDHQMKQHGKLFFVRVYISSRSENIKDEAIYASMGVLGVNGMSHLHHDGMLVGFCRMDHAPTDEQLTKIKALKGVKKVTVF